MDVNKLKGKAQNLLREHGDKIESGLTKAEKFAKSKTTKHDEKIDKVTGKIRGLIPEDAKDEPKVEPTSPPAQPPTDVPPTAG
jgi:antitoxin protein of toxin-antitoxin system